MALRWQAFHLEPACLPRCKGFIVPTRVRNLCLLEVLLISIVMDRAKEGRRAARLACRQPVRDRAEHQTSTEEPRNPSANIHVARGKHAIGRERRGLRLLRRRLRLVRPLASPVRLQKAILPIKVRLVRLAIVDADRRGAARAGFDDLMRAWAKVVVREHAPGRLAHARHVPKHLDALGHSSGCQTASAGATGTPTEPSALFDGLLEGGAPLQGALEARIIRGA